jgi:hypothetical protein
MAVYDNLSGNGIQALSAGTTSLDLYMLTLPPNRTFGNAYPNNYYHMGLLRLGSYNNWLPAFPVDALNQHIEVPADVNQVSWAMVPNSAMRLTENITSLSIPNWQKQPWDRNPTVWVQEGEAAYAGGQALTQQWSYSVPAGRNLYIATMQCVVQRQIAATSPGGCNAYIAIGGTRVIQAYDWGGAQGLIDNAIGLGAAMICPAGTAIIAAISNPDQGGSCVLSTRASGFTFDA